MSPDTLATPIPARASPPPSLVLLVEDDPLSQRLVAKIFAGHELLVAETAAEAMDLLRRHPQVDLTVVDYQLRGENGSAFVAELRRHAFCQDLPVVAYTGSRDRDVVLRYAELRAQAFHLKPYRAETLLHELARALATGRRERDFESVENACRRMKLKPAEYAGLLNSGAALLETDVQAVRRLLLSANDPRLPVHFRDITLRLSQLGVRVVAPLAQQAQRELNQGDYHACTQTLAVIDAVASLAKKRALGILSLGDSALGSDRTAAPPPSRRPERGYAHGALPAYVRPILAQPLGVLGAHALDAKRGPLLEGGRLAGFAADWWRDPAAAPWFESMRQLDRPGDATVESIAALLASIPGFESPLHLILVRGEVVRAHELPELGPETLVGRLGAAKALVLVAAGLLGRGPGKSPLALQDLRTHAIATMLLGFELGRFLRVTQPHRVAAAAITRHLGLWILAHAAPASTALVLARGASLSDLGQAETELLGGELRLAAARWLNAAGLPPLFSDVAADLDAPGEARVTLLIVRLAESLAALLGGGDAAAIAACRAGLGRADHETWAELEPLGIKPSVDLGETAELVFTLARSAIWTANEIVSPR